MRVCGGRRVGLTLIEDRFCEIRSGALVGHKAPDGEARQNARFSFALTRAFGYGYRAIQDKVDYAENASLAHIK